MTVFRESQVMQTRQSLSHNFVAANKSAMHAPSSNDNSRTTARIPQPIIIVRAYRVTRTHHVGRLCGTVGKEIGHAQSVVTPIFRKRHAPPNGRVINIFVSGARVQSHKHRVAGSSTPNSPQSISVASARTKNCCSLHINLFVLSPVPPNQSFNRTHCGVPSFGLQKPNPNAITPQRAG